MDKKIGKLDEVLRSTEKLFKTDMVYVFRGGIWALASQIIVSSLTLILAYVFANWLPKEVYGQYKYVFSITNILTALTLTGLGVSVVRSVSNGYEGSLKYAFWENLKWSVLFVFVAFIISIYYLVNKNFFLFESFLVVGGLAPIWNSTNLYSSFLSGKKDFRRNAIYFDILGNVIPYSIIIAAIFITNNPFWIVFAYFSSNTLIGLILYRKIINIYKPNKKVDPEMLVYSKHLSLMGILGSVADNIDQILVFHYIGPAELAIYNFATAIPDQIKGPTKYLSNLIFPKFAERESKDIRKGMWNKIFFLFISALLIFICYYLAAPYIFKIFFPKYLSSVPYSRIFAFSILSIISIPANTYIAAKKKVREKYLENIYGSVVQISLVYLGVVWGGLMGLVIARVITRFIFSFISISLYNKASKSTE